MSSLDEIRSQFPQYADISDNDLADAIYLTHYQGKIDRKDFDNRIGLDTTSVIGEFGKGLKHSFLSTKALAQDAGPAAIQGLLGLEASKERNLREYQREQDRINQLYGPAVGSFKDVDGFESGAEYVAGMAGQGIGSFGELLLTGVTTGGAGAVGTAALKAGAKTGLKQLAKRGGKEFSEDVIEKSILGKITPSKAFEVGTKAGTIGTAFSAGTGETYAGLLEEGVDSPAGAIVAGAFKTGLEVLPAFNVLKKVKGNFSEEVADALFEKSAKQVMAQIGKDAVTTGWQEGLTEAAQEAIDLTAEQILADNPGVFSNEGFERLVNSGIAGALGGTAIGGAASGVSQGLSKAAAPATPDSLDTIGEEITSDTVVDSETATEVPLFQRISDVTGAPVTSPSSGLLDIEAFDSQGLAQGAQRINDTITELNDQIRGVPDDPGSRVIPDQERIQLNANPEIRPPKINEQRTPEDLGFVSSIPSEKWLENKQRYAREDAERFDTGSAKRFLTNAVTGYFSQGAVSLPLARLKDLKGANNEVIDRQGPKYTSVRNSIKNEGFRADSPVLVGVNQDGEAFILEGNNRVAAAADLGVDSVPTEVKYFNGGERITDGAFSPERIARYSEESSALSPAKAVDAAARQRDVFSNPDPIMYGDTGGQLYALKSDKAADVATNIGRIVKEIAGPNIKFQPVEALFRVSDQGKYELRGAHFYNTIVTAFEYNQSLGGNAATLETALHETFHALWDNGMISDSEKKTVKSAAPRLKSYIKDKYAAKYGAELKGADLDLFDDTAELAATAFGLYGVDQVSNHNAPSLGRVQQVFSKITRLLQRIGSFLQGQGIRTPEDLFDDALAGNRQVKEIINKANTLRQQRTLSAARQARIDRTVRFAAVNLDAKKMKDELEQLAVSDPDALKVNMARRAALWMSSAPGAASSNPVIARVVNIYDQREKTHATYIKHFSNIINPAMQDRKTFVNAMSIIDHMSATEQSYAYTPEGNLVYEYGGKKFVAPKNVTATVNRVKQGFSDVLELYEDAARQNLKTLGVAEDISLNDLQAEIVARQQAFASTQAEGRSNADVTKLKQEIEALQRAFDVIQEASDMNARKVAYFPQMRKGEFGVSVRKKGETDLAYFAAVPADFTTGLADKKELARIKKDIEDQGFSPDEYEFFGLDNPIRLTNRDALKRLNIPSKAMTAELLAGFFASSNPETYGAVKDQVEAANMEVIQNFLSNLSTEKFRKDFAGHFKERQNIPGYSKAYDQVIPAYFTAFSRFITNQQYQGVQGALENAATRGPLAENMSTHMKNYLHKLIDYNNSPEHDMAMARTFNFMWALGLNISTALLQIMTLPTMTQAEMSLWSGNPLRNGAIISGAIKDASRLLSMAKGDINALQDESKIKSILKDSQEVRLIVGALTRAKINPGLFDDYNQGASDMRGVTSSRGFMRVAHKTGDVMGKPIQFAEEVSRIASLLSFYRSLEGTGRLETAKRVYSSNKRFIPLLESEVVHERAAIAEFALDNVHAIFGRAGRGENQRGVWGALIFPFMTHPIQTMENLYRYAMTQGPEGKRAFAYALTSFFVLGGVMGLPASELVEELYGLITRMLGQEKHLKTEMRTALLAGDVFSPQATEYITDGVFTAFGAEVSQRLSMPFFFQGALNALLGGDTSAERFLGVAGGLVSSAKTDAQQGFSNMSAKNYMPVALKNLYEATVLWPANGAVTRRGTQLIAAEDVTAGDVFKKAIGVMPDKVADQYEQQQFERLSKSGHQNLRNKYIRDMVELIKERNSLEPGSKGYDRAEDDMRELKKNIAKLAEKVVQNGNYRGFFDGFNNSVKARLAQEQQPDYRRSTSSYVDYRKGEILYDD